MSRDLTTLLEHAVVMAARQDIPAGEVTLWASIRDEVHAYLTPPEPEGESLFGGES